MYNCLMPLFRWELAEVAMVDVVLLKRTNQKIITNSKLILWQE